MNPWHTSPLEDLVREKQISYGVVQPGQDTPQGVPIVRVRDVRNGIVSTSNPMRVDQEIAARHRRTTLDGGELLLSLVGTVGESAVAPLSIKGWNVARAIAVLRPEGVSSRWLQLCFESPSVQAIVDSLLNTTVQATLNLSDLKQIPIPVPPPAVREGIEQVIGALDDKIAANNACIRLIDEHLAAEYERSLQQEKIVEELGVIAEFHNKRRIPLSAKQRDERPGNVPYYGASGVFGYVDEALFDEPLVLVGEDGSVINADGTPVTQYIWGPAWVNNHAHALKGKVVSTELLYYAIRRSQVSTLVTGAVQPKINMGNLKRLQLSLPALESRTSMETIIAAEVAAKRAFTTEKRTLTATRDALLPQLMSGKLRVKDAEKVVEKTL